MSNIKCYVLTMQHSSGFPDYFARVECEGRTSEFFMSKSKGQTEYHVAELNHLFNNTPKPHILDYDSSMPEGYEDYCRQQQQLNKSESNFDY